MSEKLWSPRVATINFKVQTFQGEQFKSIFFIFVLSAIRIGARYHKKVIYFRKLPEQIYSRWY